VAIWADSTVDGFATGGAHLALVAIRSSSTVDGLAADGVRSDLLDAGFPQFRGNPILPGFAFFISLTGHLHSPENDVKTVSWTISDAPREIK